MTLRREYIRGAIYHVYNRGNKKELVFRDTQDFGRYLKKLIKYCEELNVDILFYCLMPNHIHLCLRQNGDVGLNHLMQRSHISYSMYFNKKYISVGHIFQGRFKFKKVETPEHLEYLSFYVHANPSKLGANVLKYKYSSISEYVSNKWIICKKYAETSGKVYIRKFRKFLRSKSPEVAGYIKDLF